MDQKLLEQFFKEICELTINHGVYDGVDVVRVRQLGDALMKVDKKWYKKVLDNDVE